VRHARGLPVTGSTPIFHGEEDFIPNIKTLDLSELQALQNSVQNEIAHSRQAQLQQQQADAKAAQEALIEKLVQERLKATTEDVPTDSK